MQFWKAKISSASKMLRGARVRLIWQKNPVRSSMRKSLFWQRDSPCPKESWDCQWCVPYLCRWNPSPCHTLSISLTPYREPNPDKDSNQKQGLKNKYRTRKFASSGTHTRKMTISPENGEVFWMESLSTEKGSQYGIHPMANAYPTSRNLP